MLLRGAFSEASSAELKSHCEMLASTYRKPSSRLSPHVWLTSADLGGCIAGLPCIHIDNALHELIMEDYDSLSSTYLLLKVDSQVNQRRQTSLTLYRHS